MRILFLHEVGYLEKPIFEMHEFPEHLAKMGHTVGFVDFPELRTSKSEEDFGGQITGRVVDNIGLQLFSQQPSAPGILGRLAAVFTFPLFFLKVIKQFAPELVVCFAVPTSGWQAAIICKTLRIPFVFRALDVSHKIRATRLSSLIKVSERVVYSTATHVSCNNPAMLSYCRSLGAKIDRSSVNLPPLDLTHFLEGAGKRSQTRTELGIGQDERVILYMGSFFYFSGLDDVIKELGSLAVKPRLVLIGGGEKDTDLRALVDSLSLSEAVIFTGFVDFAVLPQYLSIADVAINPMLPTLVADAALPNKVLQYMASGLPIVTTKLAGLHSLFPDEPGVRYVESSSGILGEAIHLLEHGAPDLLGRANRDAVSSMFDIRDSVTSFEDMLEGVRSRQ